MPSQSVTPETSIRPDQLLSGITHDMRSPLFAITGYLDLIRRQLGDAGPTKLVEYVRLAREAGDRLNRMVEEMLEVMRSGQGSMALRLEPVSLAGLFKRLWNTFNVI